MSTIQSLIEKEITLNTSKYPGDVIATAKAYLQSFAQYHNTFDSFKAAKDEPAFAYMKITPVQLQNEYLFGTYMPIQNAYLIQACSAKRVNDEWQPNTDDVYLSCYITESHLSDVIFNQQRYNGAPITFTHVLGQDVERFERSVTLQTQYDAIINNIGRNELPTALDIDHIISDLRDTDEPLSKSLISHLKSKHKRFPRKLSSDMSFDIEMMAEKALASVFDAIANNLRAAYP